MTSSSRWSAVRILSKSIFAANPTLLPTASLSNRQLGTTIDQTEVKILSGMAGRGGKKKKLKNGRKSSDPKEKKRKGGKAKKSGTRRGKSKGARCNVDVFTEAAMENAYTTCHNVQDLLKWRGFPWPEAQKKRKGKK